MDVKTLVTALQATLDPNQRQNAEEYLNRTEKNYGFAPLLLQVIMSADVEMTAKQAGAIYLKNAIVKYWNEENATPGMNEGDKTAIRDAVVDAVVFAPDLIRVQLAECVNYIIKRDYPERWAQLGDKIKGYLTSSEPTCWKGAMLCLHKLVKKYEFSKSTDRATLINAMRPLLPLMYQLCLRLLPDKSEQSLFLLKDILKTYYALTEYSLPLDLISRGVFIEWMNIVIAIAGEPILPQPNHIDNSLLPGTAYWKCKKWACHILYKTFERYGSPGKVKDQYKEFSVWYLKTFSHCTLEIFLKILDSHKNKIYVSPNVLNWALLYIENAISFPFSWKILKDHMLRIIQEVLFPMVSHTAEDEELWTSDPCEFLRAKYDMFENYKTPLMGAEELLYSCCKKSKNILQKTIDFIMQVLGSPNADSRQKDGALHMIGCLAGVLRKKKEYKNQIDALLCRCVYPAFQSDKGHIRAKACWIIHEFCKAKFETENALQEAVKLLAMATLNDSDLPVKVEACLALEKLLSYHKLAQILIEPHIREITFAFLSLIRDTGIENLTMSMEKFVSRNKNQLMPISVDVCIQIAAMFDRFLENAENSDEDLGTASALLDTLNTIIDVTEEEPEISSRIYPIILEIVVKILLRNSSAFYEDAFSLLSDVTQKSISADSWNVLEIMHQVFQKDGLDYFIDMTSPLYNYITVDTSTFISNQNHIAIVFDMCMTVLTTNIDQTSKRYAAKLLEVIILQCKGRIDQCIQPIMELSLETLAISTESKELHAVCLNVMIASLYYNPHLFLEIMNIFSRKYGNHSLTLQFLKKWLENTESSTSLHDRKISIFGLCTFLSLTPRSEIIMECAPQIIPSIIRLFNGIRSLYAEKARSEDESSDEELYSEDESNDYRRSVDGMTNDGSSTADDHDDIDYDYESDDESLFEDYTTPIDDEKLSMNEYVVFKDTLKNIQERDTALYSVLTGHLTAEEQKELNAIFVTADRRTAIMESKRIDDQGGYNFSNHVVSQSFKFG